MMPDIMRCPACDSTLSTVTYEGVAIETCNACGGCWLDAEELGRIVTLREQRFTAAQRSAIDTAGQLPGIPVQDIERDIVCPGCNASTGPINYGGDTGIIIDRCPQCRGIWLDVGELEHIQMLVEAWKANLPEDLRTYGPLLDGVAAELEAGNQVTVSTLPLVARFINAAINGILDISV